jgi:periplasmic mercuric ion binding protein
MKNALFTTIFILFSLTVFSQKKPKVETVIITTSSQCGACKERIEGKLNYTKGIKYAELNLEIKKVFNELGYDADESKAKKEFVEKLPKCCQPGGMENIKN